MATTALRSLRSSRSSTAIRRVGLDLAAVGLGGDAVAVEQLGDHVGVALGERVDDARARQLRQVGRQPGEPVGLARADRRPPAAATRARADRGRSAARRRGRAGAARRRRPRRGRSPSRSCTARRRPRAAARASPRCAGSRAGSRGPSRRCSAPRRRPAGPTRSANSGSIECRNCGLFSRSGLISSRSTASVLEQPPHLVPAVAVGRVDRVRADPELLGRGDLVAHQRQQRRDDQRRARRPARAAARWRGSRRPTCPSPCAARTARGRDRRRGR